jgi:hypothetical protein
MDERGKKRQCVIINATFVVAVPKRLIQTSYRLVDVDDNLVLYTAQWLKRFGVVVVCFFPWTWSRCRRP